MGAKKKIAIEEVDSRAEAAPAPVKAKKKIAIEEVGSKTESPPVSPGADSSGARVLPASMMKKSAKAPKTGYEFERGIMKCKTPAEIAAYMSLVKPASIPKLLSQDLNSDILMTMVEGIGSGVEGGPEAGLKWLQTLPKVNRFDFVVDFLSADEKKSVEAVVTKLVEAGVDNTAAEAVEQKFKL